MVSTWCATHRPPRLTEAQIEAMSDDQLAAAVADLEYGERHCGWTP